MDFRDSDVSGYLSGDKYFLRHMPTGHQVWCRSEFMRDPAAIRGMMQELQDLVRREPT